MTNLQRLPDETIMGVVTLKVGHLDVMKRYYADGIGLQVISENKESILLGENGEPVILLEYAPELRHAPVGAAGLFHTAILFKSPVRLSKAVYSLLKGYSELYTGAADHLVSRAFYFDDPEGNGVELYVDYPRSEWTRFGENGVRMDTLHLDVRQFLMDFLPLELSQEIGVGSPLSSSQKFHVGSNSNSHMGEGFITSELAGDGQKESIVGHVHLKVGSIPVAKEFYADKLGFDVTMLFGGQAIFFSAGGYHHHIGANTWYSSGAGTRTPALGLGQVSIVLPDSESLGILSDKLIHHKVQLETPEENTLIFNDPWLNRVTVKVK